MAARAKNSAEARLAYYKRWYATTATPRAKRTPPCRVEIPPDIEIREHSAPCFYCGARAECRHRA